MRIRVLSGPDALAEMAATTIAGLLAGSTDPSVDLSVPGGSTVRATYNRLLEEDVAWERVDPWLGDERWVPHDHPESNGRMVDEILTERLPTTLLRPEYAPDLDPHVSAARYEGALRQIIPDGVQRRPHLAVLGVGDDGHTRRCFRVVRHSPSVTGSTRLLVSRRTKPGASHPRFRCFTPRSTWCSLLPGTERPRR